MFDAPPEFLSKIIDWISVPLTGLLGVLGFHYRKLNNHVDELDTRVDKLSVDTAVSANDIKYIKESCDKLHSRFDSIEKKLSK